MTETFEHRLSPEATISRWSATNPNAPVGVVNVPITQQSRRKFKLMQEDSITLVFSLSKPVEFKVGDFCIDELFGTFSLRERQMPTFNKTTSGWDYQLRFDKEYWLWENHIFMLAAPKGNDYIETSSETDELDASATMTVIKPTNGAQQGCYARREAKWSLTAVLAEHATQIVANLLSMSIQIFGRQVMVRVHSSASKAKEVRYISYDGMGICSAMTAMANEYECEWWVTYETTAQSSYAVVHFGKCEYGEEPLVFRPGGNMEKVTPSRDLSNYANRLFIFGGDKNIPDSYRKKLYLHIDSVEEISVDGVSKTVFWDSGKAAYYPKFDPYEMLLDPGTEKEPQGYEMLTANANVRYSDLPASSSWVTVIVEATKVNAWQDDYVGGATSEELSWGRVVLRVTRLRKASSGINELTCSGALYLDEYENGEVVESKQIATAYNYIPWNDIGERGAQIEFQAGKALLDAGKYYRIRAELDVRGNSFFEIVQGAYAEGTFSYPRGKTFSARITWNDEDYGITFNPAAVLPNAGRVCSFMFDDGVPQGFVQNDAVNEDVELHDYKSITIPLSWYTDETDNPSSVVGFGEKRLRLPSTYNGHSYNDGCLQVEGLHEVERMERTVIANHIYPKCYLRVKTVIPQENRTEKMELSDGTTYTWNWTAYGVYLEKLDGSDFPFESSFVKTGEKLQAVFLSEMDADEAYSSANEQRPQNDGEFLLAGMTFDVSFEHLSSIRTYTILRNEDYGAKLPNDRLKPSVGDLLVLTGWDVKAMDDLGLIEDAETDLLAFGEEYLDALQQDGWTFRCEMMSDWPWLLYGGDGLDTGPLFDSASNPLFARERDTSPYGSARLYAHHGRAGWGADNDPDPQYYKLPLEGTRVAVECAALSGRSKTSRVIGYELKLDYPYDSPIYEVGETEAYSRLKQLEKKLQNIR